MVIVDPFEKLDAPLLNLFGQIGCIFAKFTDGKFKALFHRPPVNDRSTYLGHAGLEKGLHR